MLFVLIIALSVIQMGNSNGFWGKYDQQLPAPKYDVKRIQHDYIRIKVYIAQRRGKHTHGHEFAQKINKRIAGIGEAINKRKKTYNEIVSKYELSDAEIWAVKFYTDDTDFAGHVNTFWNKEAIYGNQETIYSYIARALYDATHKPAREQLWATGDYIVYFGRKYGPSNYLSHLHDSPGEHSHAGSNWLSGIQSTTTSKMVAQKFARSDPWDESHDNVPIGMVCKVTIPRGHKLNGRKPGVLPVAWLSGHPNEKEILMYDIPVPYISYEKIWNTQWIQQNPVRDLILFSRELFNDPVIGRAIKNEVQKLMTVLWEYIIGHPVTKKLDRADLPPLGQQIVSPTFFNYWNKGAGEVARDINIFLDVVRTGNLREQMNLIFGFALAQDTRSKMLWNDMLVWHYKHEVQKHVSVDDIKDRIDRTERLMGLPFVDVRGMWKAVKTNPHFRAIVTKNIPGPIKYSRSPAHIYSPELRIRQNHNRDYRFRYAINKYVIPPLSPREQVMLNKYNHWFPPPVHKESILADSQIIPWETGYVKTKVDPKSIYSIEANHFHELLISGPSTTAQLVLDLAKQFENINLPLILGGLAIYMGNTPDHSIAELLMGASPLIKEIHNFEMGRGYAYRDLRELLLHAIRNNNNNNNNNNNGPKGRKPSVVMEQIVQKEKANKAKAPRPKYGPKPKYGENDIENDIDANKAIDNIYDMNGQEQKLEIMGVNGLKELRRLRPNLHTLKRKIETHNYLDDA